MNISQNVVGLFHYTLKNDEGEIIDSSEGKAPLAYLHGAGNIVSGLEKEMEGKTTGDTFSTVVSPQEGYGEYDAEKVQSVPREMFKGTDTIEVGMQFHAETPAGAQIVEVAEVDANQVTINANHPLAGQNLHFDIEITDVREASQEELDHGHVHGEGGHEH